MDLIASTTLAYIHALVDMLLCSGREIRRKVKLSHKRKCATKIYVLVFTCLRM